MSLIFSLSLKAAEPIPFRLIAFHGMQSPSLPSVRLDHSTVPPIQPAGLVFANGGRYLLNGGLYGSVQYYVDDAALWAGHAGGADIVFRRGQDAPGLSAGHKIQDIGFASINSSGYWVTSSRTNYGPVYQERQGIWGGLGTNSQLIVHPNTLAPGANRGFIGFGVPYIGDSGVLAFSATLSGSGVVPGVNDKGLWMGMPGSLSMVARMGDALPGIGNGIVLRSFYVDPVFTRSESFLFRADLAGPGVVSGVNDSSLWEAKNGQLTLLARTGAPPPTAGGPAVASVGFAGRQGVDGTYAFTGLSAIWAGRPDSLSLVAKVGDMAPGTSRTFTSFGEPNIASASHLTFNASLSAGHSGIWHGPISSPQLLASSGQIAPGTAGGVFTSIRSYANNAEGIVAFVASFTPAEPHRVFDDTGLWVYTPELGLTLLHREGDVFDADPGPSVRVVVVPEFINGPEFWLNDTGELLVEFHYDTLVYSVPEPTLGCLVGITALLLGRRRRRLTPTASR